MSQNSLVLANGTGAAFRAAANNSLDTLLTLNSGSSAPSPTSAYMLWADSGSGKLKIRNAGNSAWVEIGTLASTFLGLASLTQTNAWAARQDLAKGTNIASAGTITLGGGGNFFHITGTTTITAFDTLQAGTLFVVEFEGSLTLTHNATSLILADGVNAVTQAGDVFVFVSEGSGNVREVARSRRDVAVSGAGRFQYQSATECRFLAFNGNRIMINGKWETIPSGTTGVSFPNTGLTGGPFLRYAYIYMSSGVMTGEWSATAWATDTATGMPIKTGDATRTLVGMAYVNSSNQFTDSAAQRFVLSRHNRRAIKCTNSLSTDRTTSSTSATEVSNTSTERIEYITWADTDVLLSMTLSAGNGAGGVNVYAGMGIDGATASAGLFTLGSSPGANYWMNMSCHQGRRLSEGYHYGSLIGWTASGTATFLGGSSNAMVSTHQAEIWG